MALIQEPNFSSPSNRYKQLTQVGYGGVNLRDSSNTLNDSQSPNMINLMYQGNVLRKRYGQQFEWEYEDIIYGLASYNGELVVHSGANLYRGLNKINSDPVAETQGKFFNFNRMLYYICGGKYYQFDGITYKEVEPYVPDLIINRKPDGSIAGDAIEDYNMIGASFKVTFDGDGESTVYQLPDSCKPLDNSNAVIWIDGVLKTNGYSVNASQAKITFTSAPAEGTNNVVIQVNKLDGTLRQDIYNCKFSIAYGGGNNSRMFFGGNEKSTIYYSSVYDATYFPDSCYMTIGNTESDITGFGEQYDVCMVFKPKEIYKLDYYQDDDGVGHFTSNLVNAEVGCDSPHTIKLINNQLTWLNSSRGVMTLVSTNIEDERNVRPISYNIESSNGILGELNIITDEENNFLECENDDIIVSGSEYFAFDYDSKYWLCVNSRVYCWDYLIAPYYNSGKILQDSSRCAWFIFDGIDIDMAIINNWELYFASGNQICKLNNSQSDFGKPISAIYQTPLMELYNSKLSAFDYLKNIRKLEIQTYKSNGSIDIVYNTESGNEYENESLILNNEQIATVQRRKVSIKKCQLFGLTLSNTRLNEDMPIGNISIEYSNVKMVK